MQFLELSITNSFEVENPFSIKVRAKSEGMCCSITSVEATSGLAGQDESGIGNDSKSKYIVNGANHRAIKFLNRKEFLSSPGIFIVACAWFRHASS